MKREVGYTDIIEIYKDPGTEQIVEGYAMVQEILEEDDEFYTLQVSFLDDPAYRLGRKFTRKYRKYEINAE